jgi:large subunit ribosomal protein L13
MRVYDNGFLHRGIARTEVNMSTYMAKQHAVEQRWYLIDATDQIVGRLAVQIANILRGKHRPDYTPHVDLGDFVVVINADKIRFTGKKLDTQTYSSYSRYPGGLKTVTARQLMEKHPDRILEAAVRRMVPRNRLGRQQMSKLKIYAGSSHPHQAQQPQELKIAT